VAEPGAGPGGGGRPPPLFLDHTEARRAEKSFLETGPRSYLRVWMTASPPLPPLPPPYQKVWIPIGPCCALIILPRPIYVSFLSFSKQSDRYCCKDDSACVLHGKIALARKGLSFAKTQLLRGIKMFQAVTKGDYADFLDDSAVEATEVDVMDEQSDSVEVDWEDISFDLSNPDFMAESLSMCEQPATMVDGDVCKWLFPPEFCQSSIDGRNGSNACSVISLAVTHWFLTSNGNFPGPGALSSEWINRFHVCMILGNSIYDNARQSLPHRYLTAAEAAQLFSDYAAVKVGQPYPVRLEDPHPLSTLPEQIRLLTREKKPCAALFIYDDKTVSFLVCQSGSVLFVDSHSHPPYGAAVILANNLSPAFFSCVAEIALLSSTTFGNFSRIAV